MTAGRGDLPGAAAAPQPGEAGWLLLRGRAPPPRLRVHGPRQPREPPLPTYVQTISSFPSFFISRYYCFRLTKNVSSLLKFKRI